MSEQQFYSTLLLLAIAISTSLQVISLQEKKRWVGCVAVAFILGLIPAVLFTPFTKQITEIPQKKQPTILTLPSKSKSSFLIEFEKEFTSLEVQLKESLPTQFSSDIEQETFARKILSIREKVSLFHNKVQKHKFSQETEFTREYLLLSSEHLKAAAFAFYAGASTEDSSFREFQANQKKEQLDLARKYFMNYQNLFNKNTNNPQTTTGFSHE